MSEELRYDQGQIEMTAEAYAEFKNNPKVRMIAKKIGDRIKEKYKELYGK
jgi:sulfur relay (sulfurtransferase) DsrC/TusE family protein